MEAVEVSDLALRIGDYVARATQGTTFQVRREGRPVAVMMSAEIYDRLHERVANQPLSEPSP